MRLMPLVSAAVLALASAVSHAEDINTTVTLVPDAAVPGSFSAAFSVTHTSAGAFTDVFTITGSGGGAVGVSASLVTIGFMAYDNIDLFSATLNGVALDLTGSGSGVEVGSLPTIDVTGALTLVVSGVAAPTLTAGSAIAASFGGTVNVSSPLPEPGTYAMLLAGLGVVTLLGRRTLRR